jgi:phosphate transport system substrate-binding protein
MKFWQISSLGLALSVVGVLSGCGNNASTDNTASGAATSGTEKTTATSEQSTTRINAAGATFPYPLYTKWFETYNNTKGVQVNYQSVGSGAGIKQLAAGTMDFAASDAPLGSKDLKAFSAPVETIPTVAGAVVIAYNLPGAPTDLKLTGTALADIYLGKIKRWNDAAIAKSNPGVTLPSTAIIVSHRSDGSGTTNIFTSYLADVSPEWKEKVGAGKAVSWPTGIGGKGNDGVTATVKQAPGGIGYVELAYAKQNKLPYASIQNKSGEYIAPSAEASTKAAVGALGALKTDITASIANSAAKGAYPISGFTYIMVYKQSKDAAKGKAIKDLLTWAITEGQKDAAALDYAPLPAEVVELNKKAIAGLK